jgi:hypothetical protein
MSQILRVGECACSIDLTPSPRATLAWGLYGTLVLQLDGRSRQLLLPRQAFWLLQFCVPLSSEYSIPASRVRS